MLLRLRWQLLEIILPGRVVCDKFAKSIKFVQPVNSELGLRCIMVIKTSRNRQEEAV